MAMGVETVSICSFLKAASPKVCPSPSLALDSKGWKSGNVSLPARTGLRINAAPRTFLFDLVKKERGFRRIVCEAQEIVTQAAELTDLTWQHLVLESDVPVLVDFWAPWCGPCRMIAPLIDELARQYAGKMKCFKVNTDENPDIASKYGIRSIPTVMFFLNGQKMDTVIGAVPKTTLTTTIEKLMVLSKRNA